MRSSRAHRATVLCSALVVAASCGARGPRAAIPSAPSLDAAARLARDLDADLAAPRARAAIWGVRVESLDRPGETLFAHGADQLMVPASNMKILTLAAAADRLGWDHTFATIVRATAPLEPDGTLRGDLVVRGSGDPTIGNRPESATRLADWAEALWQRGLRRVDGRVIGDDGAFANEALGEGWAWDDVPYGYSAPESALIYNENTAALAIAPGPSAGTFATGRLLDRAAGLRLQVHVMTGPAGSQKDLSLARLPGSNLLRVTGTVPAGVEPVVRYVAVDDPAAYFAAALREALIARGIAVAGGAGGVDDMPPGPLAPDAPTLFAGQSPPLADIARRLMKVSQNLYAETFLRQAAVVPDGQSSSALGIKAVRDTLTGWGVDPGSFTQSDGSGLSRYNLVSPTAFVRVLAHLYADPRLKDPWLAALPVAGADGTLEHRLRGTPAAGRVHAKTGSLSGVRSLSGYLQTTSGEWLVFSIIANNFAVPAPDIDAVTDGMLQRLVAFSR